MIFLKETYNKVLNKTKNNILSINIVIAFLFFLNFFFVLNSGCISGKFSMYLKRFLFTYVYKYIMLYMYTYVNILHKNIYLYET